MLAGCLMYRNGYWVLAMQVVDKRAGYRWLQVVCKRLNVSLFVRY